MGVANNVTNGICVFPPGSSAAIQSPMLLCIANSAVVYRTIGVGLIAVTETRANISLVFYEEKQSHGIGPPASVYG